MASAPCHRCTLIGSPWTEVYATRITSSRHYARHTHSAYGLGVVDAGAQRSASGRHTVDAFAGDLVATNPGEVHDGRPLGGPLRSWRTIYIEPAFFAGLAPFAGEVAITRAAFADPELQQATLGLLGAMARWQQGSADALACEEALASACGLLLARHVSRPSLEPVPSVSMARVRERLAAGLLQPPTLAELAGLAGLSRFQLLRRFAALHGLTPHAWLVQQRTEHARALIAGGMGLAEAAALSGFADQSHMTRSFTRQFGFTPGAWQRARLQ
ncbi:AraC family transcriptional regulator [Ramlibacter sp. G-1-2-2]|uniref:AraC family transcriptional regulator n=1 Tax=Ramlibacter agri TaxID=2728837 RepID=A0A848H647_9BURK|nr:AraC family transcriptional regulator [Ramlibacter agri]NML44989.1 AraC family transcriptional regulator [Ramlibacter agri]